MARKKQTFNTILKYDFDTLYRYVLRKRKEESLSDKLFGIAASRDGKPISERQIRNAQDFDIGMDFYQLDTICRGLNVDPKAVFEDDYLTLESLFAPQLEQQEMTWAQIVEMAKGTRWEHQDIMQQHAFRMILCQMTGRIFNKKDVDKES